MLSVLAFLLVIFEEDLLSAAALAFLVVILEEDLVFAFLSTAIEDALDP